MTDWYAGRVVALTGAGSGIGRALAVALAGRGARLALSDVDTAGLEETAERCRLVGAAVRADVVDVADPAAVAAWADAVASTYGVVNVVVNNAGIAYTGGVVESSLADMHRVVDVDFWGVVHGTRAFLPHLTASGNGNVVNVSSLYGILAAPGQSAYNAAKFAVRGFTEALRQEMIAGRVPVRVTCVHPGGIQTGILRNSTAAEGVDQQRLAEIFDTRLARTSAPAAARTILRAVEAGRPRVLVGTDAKVLDVVVRVTGARYQRAAALVSRQVLARVTRAPEVRLTPPGPRA